MMLIEFMYIEPVANSDVLFILSPISLLIKIVSQLYNCFDNRLGQVFWTLCD